LQEIVGAFFARDGGGFAVAGEDVGIAREGQELVVDGLQDLAAIPAGEISAADAVAEEGIAGDEFTLGGHPEADAALGVAGGVEHVDFSGADEEFVAVLHWDIDGYGFRSAHAEPCGLHVEHSLQFGVLEVHIYGGAGGELEFLGAADVIDVGVGDHDGGHGEAVPLEDFEDAVDFVAGIDDHGLAGGFVAEDRAVTLQHADGQDLVDHKASILTNMGEILTALMRWVHISSVVTLIGGIIYARFVAIPSAGSLSPDARTAFDEGAAGHFRPLVFAAMTGLVISGLFNYLSKPGHSVLYSSLFGVKILLVLHVFSVAILATARRNPRLARQLFGAAVSGLTIVLISAYLKGIA
jgi:uncharacterized membrane protein